MDCHRSTGERILAFRHLALKSKVNNELPRHSNRTQERSYRHSDTSCPSFSAPLDAHHSLHRSLSGPVATQVITSRPQSSQQSQLPKQDSQNHDTKLDTSKTKKVHGAISGPPIEHLTSTVRNATEQTSPTADPVGPQPRSPAAAARVSISNLDSEDLYPAPQPMFSLTSNSRRLISH